MNNLKFGVSLAATCSASILAGYFYYQSTIYFSETCRTTLNYITEQNNEKFSMDVDLVMTFHKNRRGELYISGKAELNGQPSFINKRQSFNYKYIDNRNYHVEIKDITNLYNDNISEDFIYHYLPTLALGNTRHLSFEKITDNTLLISNRHAPMITCVIDQ
ncbi:hypothetical protein [Vibrio cincinnatiensis]|uniref:hypothetical protein n=1 Tax=Vibrio cincinnatiensis TaxID=675 RepID=UPI001EDEF9B0|nr:hypothetical protein [Vibrio cincinnatiensis]MCG3728581.1 hypothetical protein [Vibrio cincinnatiensis]